MVDFAIGVYFFILGWAIHTRNFQSFLVFKAPPFFAGVYLMIKSAKELGWM